MKFSIATSFFNTSEYVEKLYDSILSQTYQNWEWVVTDDFSEVSAKDKLIEISKKDSRVKYINQEFKQELYWNPHKYSSLNSDFILHLGSDDTLYPKTLEVYKHFFQKYPEVTCMVSGGKRIKEDGKWKNYLFGEARNINCADWRTKFGPTETMLITKAWRHTPFPLLDFNPGNQYKKRREDLNILLRLEETGKILCLNRCLSDITVREKSLSNSKDANTNIEAEKTYRKILADTDKRRKGSSLYTFKKIFEEEYEFLCAFYGEWNNSPQFKVINILNPSFTPKQMDLLQELYFDLEFRVDNFDPHTSLNYFIIQTLEDFEYLKTIPVKGLKIYTILDILDRIKKEVIKGQMHYYQILGDKKWVEIF